MRASLGSGGGNGHRVAASRGKHRGRRFDEPRLHRVQPSQEGPGGVGGPQVLGLGSPSGQGEAFPPAPLRKKGKRKKLKVTDPWYDFVGFEVLLGCRSVVWTRSRLTFGGGFRVRPRRHPNLPLLPAQMRRSGLHLPHGK